MQNWAFFKRLPGLSRASTEGLSRPAQLTAIIPTHMVKAAEKTQIPWRRWLLPLALLVLFLGLRLPGLGRFATIDEVYWIQQSANFRLAVLDGDWANTASRHPAVTTMWAGVLGIQMRFPQLDTIPQQEITDFHLRHFLWQKGVNPIELIAAGRLMVVLLCAAAFALLWSPLRRLLGEPAAAAALALIALDPYLVGHQRLLHQDGLMAAFGLVSIAYFTAYIHSGKRADLLVSAAAAGLAWLTKSPMLVLAPLAAALAWWGWRKTPADQSRAALRWLGAIALWGVMALAVFTLLWPAMWADPLAALNGVLSYARGSAQGEFSGPIFFNGEIFADGRLGWASLIFYPLSFLWRATPLMLLGLAAALWARPWSRRHPSEQNSLLAGLGGFALLFIIAMSIAEKKFDRYMLPAYAALLPVAGWGLAQVLASLQTRLKPAVRRWAPAALAAALLGGQLWASAANFPYYLQHYNPLLGGAANAQHSMMLGWGEGLEQAAQYLQSKTNRDTQVASWYSNLFTLFYGDDVADIPILAQLSREQLEQLLAMDYLVIYIHQWQRGTPQNLLDALELLEPETRVWINGLEYVRVYHLNGG